MPRALSLEFRNSRTDENIIHDVFGYRTRENTTERKYKNKVAQVSLIYGRNGAGKSTFARDIVDHLTSGTCTVRTIDNQTLEILESNSGKRVEPSLFNEDLLSKVSFESAGGADGDLKTIVLFEEQKENRTKIKTTEADIKEQQKTLEESKERVRELETKLIHQSRDALKKQLSGKNSWKTYQEQARNSKVQIRNKWLDSLPEKISDDEKGQPLDALVKERDELLEQLNDTRNQQSIPSSIPEFTWPWDLSIVEALLAEVPAINATSETAKHYQGLLQTVRGAALFEVAKTELTSNETTHCPLCTQELKENVKQQITLALQEIAEEDSRAELIKRVGQLETIKVERLHVLETSQRQVLRKATAADFDQTKEDLLQVANKINSLITSKIEHPDSSTDLPVDEAQRVVKAFEAARIRVEKELRTFNKEVTRFEQNLERFEVVNLQAALRTASVHEAVKSLGKLLEEMKTLKDKETETQNSLAELNRELERLRSADLNHVAAVKLINEYLTVVFADPDRLTLHPSNNSYRVSVRGHDVRVNDLSTGEKNIIALCYFFAEIFKNSNDHTLYKEQRFIVLDDPVSSFDHENRFGVLRLLKQLTERFIRNDDTQIIMLSHDLSLIQELAAIMKIIDKATVATKQIKSRNLTPLKIDEFDVYSESLKRIYDYACLDDPDSADDEAVPSGNEMRQVLEAFAEFEVSSGIVELPTSKIIREAIKDQSQALGRYFNGPLYKLLLHGESHTSDAVRAGRPSMEPLISREARQEVAQELIALISVIAPVHVPSKLKMKTTAKAEGAYLLSDYESHCFDWKDRIEQRTLEPTN